MNVLRLFSISKSRADNAEQKLVAFAQSGDRQAFDALAATYTPLLRGFLLRRVGANAVDDVLQETLLAGWTALPGYTRRAHFKAWLFAIAVRKCVDFYRARSRMGAEVPLEEAEGHMGTQQDWDTMLDWKQSVRSVLTLLASEQREVVEMYYYAELSLPEIAVALERNLNTVKYQFYRAHTLIERALTDDIPVGNAVIDSQSSSQNKTRKRAGKNATEALGQDTKRKVSSHR